MTTPNPHPPLHGEAVATITRLLEHERLMSVGTLRADGWPQVTTANLSQLSDYAGFKHEFRTLFGFELSGIDYTKPVEIDRPWG